MICRHLVVRIDPNNHIYVVGFYGNVLLLYFKSYSLMDITDLTR